MKFILRSLELLFVSCFIFQCSDNTGLQDYFSYSGESLRHVAVPIGGIGTGWGNFTKEKDMVILELDYGTLKLNELSLGNLTGNKKIEKIEFPVKTEYQISNNSDIIFKNTCLLKAGEQIRIILN